MLFHRGGRRDRRRGLVGAGACALGLDVAGGWCVGGGWRWRARSGRGCWLARGWWLALARSVRTWLLAGACVTAGAGALGPDVTAGWRVGGGWLALLLRLRDTILLEVIRLLYHMIDAISGRKYSRCRYSCQVFLFGLHFELVCVIIQNQGESGCSRSLPTGVIQD